MYAICRSMFWSKLMFVLIVLFTNEMHAKKSPKTRTAKETKDSTITSTPIVTLPATLLSPVGGPNIQDDVFKTTATDTYGQIATGNTATNVMTTTAASESEITLKPSDKKAKKVKTTKKAKREKNKDKTFTTLTVKALDITDNADSVFKTETFTIGAITRGITETPFETTTLPSEGKSTHRSAAKETKTALGNTTSVDVGTTSDKVAPELFAVNFETTVMSKTEEITDKTFPPTIPDGEFKTTGSVNAGGIAPGITIKYLKTTTFPAEGKINHKPTAQKAKKSKKAKKEKKKGSTLTTTPQTTLDETDIKDDEVFSTATVTTRGITSGITETHFMTTTVPSEGKSHHKPSTKKMKKAKKEKKKNSTLATTPQSPSDKPEIQYVEDMSTATVFTEKITSGIIATHFMTTTVPSEGKGNHKPSTKKMKKAKKEKKKNSTLTTTPQSPSDKPDIQDVEDMSTATVFTEGISSGITTTHFMTTTVPSEGKNHKPSTKKMKKAKKEKKKDSTFTTTPQVPLDEPDIEDVEVIKTATVTSEGITSGVTATHFMTTTVPSKGETNHKPSTKKTKKEKKKNKKDSISTTQGLKHTEPKTTEGKITFKPSAEESKKALEKIAALNFRTSTEIVATRISEVDLVTSIEPTTFKGATEDIATSELPIHSSTTALKHTIAGSSFKTSRDASGGESTQTSQTSATSTELPNGKVFTTQTAKTEEIITNKKPIITRAYTVTTSPTPVLSEAVIAAELPASRLKPSVRTDAMIANESPVIAREDLESIARTENYEEMVARTARNEHMIARTENYEDMIARTDKSLEDIAGPGFVTSSSPVLSEAVIAAEFSAGRLKPSARTDAMIARKDLESIARTENYEAMIARTARVGNMIARTARYEHMIARTDKSLEDIAGPGFVTSPSPVLSEAVIAAEFPAGRLKPSVRTDAMIARKDMESIARTENYDEMIARTERVGNMIAQTARYEHMIAQTDKSLEAIAGPGFVTSPSPVLSEAVIAAEFPAGRLKPSVRTDAMIARKDLESIARTENYEAMIARTARVGNMIARTARYENMIARTEKSLEDIAGPGFVTSPSPVLSDAVIAAEFPAGRLKPSVRTDAMIARKDMESIARTENYDEMIARTERVGNMIARTARYEHMIAQTDKSLEALAGPGFVTSPSPVLSEAVIAAEFPAGRLKPSVRTDAMIARNDLESIARTENYEAMIARTARVGNMIARTARYENMIARTEKNLEDIAGPDFVTSPSPLLGEAVIALEFPRGIFKTEAVIANESPVIARENLETIARTPKNLESIAGPDFVTSHTPDLSDAVIAANFSGNVLEPSVRAEALIANDSPVIATNTILPDLSEAVIAPENPMAMTMNVKSAALSDLSDEASADKRSNTSAYAVTTAVTTSMEPIGLQHNQLGRLLDSVLIDYDLRLRPRKNQARFVTIFSDFVPQSIIEFNTLLQSFTVMGYFKMDWRDDFLKWNFNDYGDTKYLRIPAKSIWIPKLIVDKSRDGNGLVGDRKTDVALIHYRGYVRWFPEGIYSVVCKVSIRFFPFDVQTCTLSYYIADEDASTINLKHEGHVDLSEYIENAEWNLINVTSNLTKVDNVHIVNFRFEVERRGGFTMFTLVVPVLLLSMLSGATFLIPIESGEKCGFSVTIFLAYGIFETIVIDTLPHNSLDVSYFIIYLTVMVIVSIMLTFYTILQAKVFDMIGAEEFRLMRCSNNGDGISWGTFLRKLDTYVFVVFLVLVLGSTATFFAVLVERLHFLEI